MSSVAEKRKCSQWNYRTRTAIFWLHVCAGSVCASFAPKLDAATRLQAAVWLLPLGATVLFSSVAALFGAVGQTNYSAANAALEGWASAEVSGGKAVSAIQWGAWAAGAQRLSLVTPTSLLGISFPWCVVKHVTSATENRIFSCLSLWSLLPSQTLFQRESADARNFP